MGKRDKKMETGLKRDVKWEDILRKGGGESGEEREKQF
jgi:hypothetical protein